MEVCKKDAKTASTLVRAVLRTCCSTQLVSRQRLALRELLQALLQAHLELLLALLLALLLVLLHLVQVCLLFLLVP